MASPTCQRHQLSPIHSALSLASAHGIVAPQWQVQLASDIESEGATVLGSVHCTLYTEGLASEVALQFRAL